MNFFIRGYIWKIIYYHGSKYYTALYRLLVVGIKYKVKLKYKVKYKVKLVSQRSIEINI